MNPARPRLRMPVHSWGHLPLNPAAHSIWGITSDRSSAVVLASGGRLHPALPHGYTVAFAALVGEGAAATSLQMLASTEVRWYTDNLWVKVGKTQ